LNCYCFFNNISIIEIKNVAVVIEFIAKRAGKVASIATRAAAAATAVAAAGATAAPC